MNSQDSTAPIFVNAIFSVLIMAFKMAKCHVCGTQLW